MSEVGGLLGRELWGGFMQDGPWTLPFFPFSDLSLSGYYFRLLVPSPTLQISVPMR